MVKPFEARKTLVSVADDLFDLIERLKDDSQITFYDYFKSPHNPNTPISIIDRGTTFVLLISYENRCLNSK